jgi:hypothetical protein
MQDADKREIRITLGKIKPVADHEQIRNAEPDAGTTTLNFEL